MAAPILDAITIEGFKSIASIRDLPMRRMNVLIGANGSGKSNFIALFRLLHEWKNGRLQHHVATAGGANRLLHFGAKQTPEIRVALRMPPERALLRLTLTATETDSLLGNARLRQGRSTGAEEWRDTWLPPKIDRRFGRWRIYHLHDTSASSPLRKTARLHDNEFLRGDAGNLPAFLYLLQERQPTAYARVRAAVQQIAPFFDDFNLRPTALDPEAIRLEWRHRESDQMFDAAALSDGTLRFIALATLFLQPPELRPDIILIDEPELGLHPAAINLLAALAKSAAVGTQVVLATQSSHLLDHFEPEDVLVAERIRGATQFRRLESEELKTWLEEYSLGELWEKNEFGGRPAREDR